MVLCLTVYISFSAVRPGACRRSFGRYAVEGFTSMIWFTNTLISRLMRSLS